MADIKGKDALTGWYIEQRKTLAYGVKIMLSGRMGTANSCGDSTKETIQDFGRQIFELDGLIERKR